MEEKNVYHYWAKQPEAMKEILAQRKTLTAEFVSLYRNLRPDRIYLIGSGTSFNAENAAAPFLQTILGIEVTAVISSRIPQKLFGERPLVVFISQGGSSTNTLEAMEKLSAYPCLTITGEEDCEIQKRSRHHMLIGCGQEAAGPKTMGYTSSVLCFYVCALEAGLDSGSITEDEYSDFISCLRLAADNMEENIRRANEWFNRNAESLKAICKYVIVGKDIAGVTASEGGLKILETIKVPTMCFEFEEYLHGPIIVTDAALGGIFFITEDPADKPRMLELAKCHGHYSEYSYIVTSDASITGKNVLHVLATGRPFTEVFEFILVPQLLAAKVPAILGLSDGSEVYDLYTSRCPTKYNNGR